MSGERRDTAAADGPNACVPPPSDKALETMLDGLAVPAAAVGERSLRVLVADDDRDMAYSLSMLLRRWGHDVRATYGGAEALRAAAAYRPDVLLLDIGMPELDGYHLAEQLRQQSCFEGTLMIAITGYADVAHRLLAERAGFDLVLVKPVEPEVIRRLLLIEHDRLALSTDPLPKDGQAHGIQGADDESGLSDLLTAGWA